MDIKRNYSTSNKKPDVKDLVKLTLWNSEHFSPIMSHEELEPIMAKLGFISGQLLPPRLPLLGAVSWRPYIYTASCRWMRKLRNPPTVKLPYPKIDGLHESTYSAFLDAVNFYLEEDDISTIFHVRKTRIIRSDLPGKWKDVESDMGHYMYRPRTIDLVAVSILKDPMKHETTDDNGDDDMENSLALRIKKKSSDSCNVVPLKDISVMFNNHIESANWTEIKVQSSY